MNANMGDGAHENWNDWQPWLTDACRYFPHTEELQKGP